MTNTSIIVLSALFIEAMFGYPARLAAFIPHPVIGIGWIINQCHRVWNRDIYTDQMRKIFGIVVVGLLVFGGWSCGIILTQWAGSSWIGLFVLAMLGTSGLAQRSLFDHVHHVYLALIGQDLPQARRAVSMIVGRDTAVLDESGIAAAALESLAESFCDGVVAPAFWFLIGGMGGLIAFKAVSTADSMIGHKEMPWRDFGWAAARCDDVMNWIPARLSGGLIVMAGSRGWPTMMRDGAKHISPNAGWPEAAMAGALGICLGGDAFYDGQRIVRAQFGSGARPLIPDLLRGLQLYRRACGLLWLSVAMMGMLWPL